MIRCPNCNDNTFDEWHEELPGLKRGGRWCHSCGYGVHPPSVEGLPSNISER